MPETDSSAQNILPCTGDFTRFVSSCTYPVAVLPPAIAEALGMRAGAPELAEAFGLLGFAGVRFISSCLAEFSAGLGNEAAARGGVLLFTACPPIVSLVSAEYPRLQHLFSRAVPPADQAVRAVKQEHPGATVFFISPCSARARALDSADYAVPFASVFPALLAALGSTAHSSAAPSLAAGAEAGDMRSGGSYHEVISSPESARTLLDALALGRAAVGGQVVEFIACRGGCSKGDWSPCSGPDA